MAGDSVRNSGVGMCRRRGAGILDQRHPARRAIRRPFDPVADDGAVARIHGRRPCEVDLSAHACLCGHVRRLVRRARGTRIHDRAGHIGGVPRAHGVDRAHPVMAFGPVREAVVDARRLRIPGIRHQVGPVRRAVRRPFDPVAGDDAAAVVGGHPREPDAVRAARLGHKAGYLARGLGGDGGAVHDRSEGSRAGGEACRVRCRLRPG